MEQQEIKTPTAVSTAESNEGYGKFRDKESLVLAYNSLQAEFTKRCQRIKELEVAVKELKQAEVGKGTTVVEDNGLKAKEEASAFNEQPSVFKAGKDSVTEELKNEIIKEYLNNLKRGGETAKILTSGEAVKAPPKRPRSVSEAGAMAKQYFLLNKEIK